MQVLQHLGSMSNQILQSNAIKQLASLKTSNPDLFKRPQVSVFVLFLFFVFCLSSSQKIINTFLKKIALF